jgi:hypothetical protein
MDHICPSTNHGTSLPFLSSLRVQFQIHLDAGKHDLIQWYSNGTAAVAGSLSAIGLVVIVYLLYCMYQYKCSGQGNTQLLPLQKIARFFILSFGITLLDWTGIVLYQIGDPFYIIVAFEILHLRVVLLVFRFTQLRSIVIDPKTIEKAQKEKTMRTNTLQSKLKDQEKPTHVVIRSFTEHV